MAKKRNQEARPLRELPSNPTPAEGSPPQPPVLTPEQQALAARLQTEHAVLKAKFADVSVALDIATQERNQLVQRLQMTQQIIEKLTKELEEAKKAAATPDVKEPGESEAE